MKTPAGSFVIPVYNGQAFIAETLQSCLDQSNPRFETVVVDDGSTDGTLERLEYFQSLDERIRVIRLGKNGGRSNARNIGIEAAKSNLILTLDADDINKPDRLEKTLKFFRKNPGVDIVYSDCFNIDVWGDLIIFEDGTGNQADTITATPFDMDRLKKTLATFIPCHSSMSFKKHVFDKVRYMDGDFSKHGIDDWKFQVDAFNAGFKFGQINRVLVSYRNIPKERDEAAIKELKMAVLG